MFPSPLGFALLLAILLLLLPSSYDCFLLNRGVLKSSWQKSSSHYSCLFVAENPMELENDGDSNKDLVQRERNVAVAVAAVGMGTLDEIFDDFDRAAVRPEDFDQSRDLDLILTERADRYDTKSGAGKREKCLLIAVDVKLAERRAGSFSLSFTLSESLSELSELVGTAGMEVLGVCVQRLNAPNSRTYVGPGKIEEIMASVNSTGAKTIVIDDDLTSKQQRGMEDVLAAHGGADVKVLDRTAVILEIFAQHAQSREGQLQVELAQLQYRLTRGPRASGSSDRDSGCGFRGPGESKVETDKRVIREKIVFLKREIDALAEQRDQHRQSRSRLGLPVVALVGYTNAGKSSLLNRLSRAGVLAEDMLFATLDTTVRRVRLTRGTVTERGGRGRSAKGLKRKRLAKTKSVRGAAEGEIMTTDDLIALQPQGELRSEPEGELVALATSPLPSTDDNVDDDDNDGVYGDDSDGNDDNSFVDAGSKGGRKGQEVLLSDTVGFISKLPTDLVAAFRATLEAVANADVLVHVCDRSSPVWRKQRETVLRELSALGCDDVPIIELWNKIDNLPDPEEVRLEAACMPIDVEAEVLDEEKDDEAERSSSPLFPVDQKLQRDGDGGDYESNRANRFQFKQQLQYIEEEDENVKEGREEDLQTSIDDNDDENIYDSNDKELRRVDGVLLMSGNQGRGEGGAEGRDSRRASPMSPPPSTPTLGSALGKSLRARGPYSAQAVQHELRGGDRDRDRGDGGGGARALRNRNRNSDVQWTARSSVFAGTPGEEEGYVWSEDDEYVRDSNTNQGSDSAGAGDDSAGTSNSQANRNPGRGGSVMSSSSSGAVSVSSRKTFVVAASVKTGLGFDDFLGTLEDALTLRLKKVEVFIPFSKDDGLIAMIHDQGVADCVEYDNVGTFLRCRVPEALLSRLQPFRRSPSPASRRSSD